VKAQPEENAVSTTLNVALVLDMSGSMGSIRSAAVEGANTYIKDLQDDEDAAHTFMTLVIFDHLYEVWAEDKPVKEIEFFGDRYQPRGSTALYDAIAKTIGLLDNAMVGERADEKALVVILTDGFENASVEYRGEEGRMRLAALVEAYEKRGNWTFVYLGANDYNVKTTARAMGMSAGNAAYYAATADSVQHVMAAAATVTATNKSSLMRNSSSSFEDAGVSDDYRDDTSGTNTA